jgi:hypothetical protein
MDSVLKVACVVLKNRMVRVLGDIISFEQAGFRPHEECGAHVAALYEIAQRRSAAGLPLYLAFIDFRKAFDSVPHDLLLQQLSALGISGRFLNFVQAMYDVSSVRVRLGGVVSESVAFKRGIRQGCPLSPLLFNAFIDQIAAKVRPYGVVSSDGVKKVGCLMFADDVVLMASSFEDLRLQVNIVDAFCHRTNMSLNVAKCATMLIGPSGVPQLAGEVRCLNGVIPFCKSYKYLGVNFAGVNGKRAAMSLVEARKDKAQRAVFALLPFLRMRDIPLSDRLAVVKSVIMPIAAHGLEFLPLRSKGKVAQVDAWITKALNVVVNGSTRSRCSPLVLRRECGVPPLFARVMASRARMFLKFINCQTVIARMYGGMERGGLSCVHSTSRWFRKIGLYAGGKATVFGLAVKTVRDKVWEQMEEVGSGVSWAWYRRNQFSFTTAYLARRKCSESPMVGIIALAQLRSRSFLIGERLCHMVNHLQSW